MNDRTQIPPIIPPEQVAGCQVVAMSDVGRVREENQDFMGYVSRGQQQLLIVADGMGGHSGGYEASRIAVDVLGNVFGKSEPSADPAQVLLSGVTAANTAVRSAAENDPELSGMGSTITAALVSDGKAWLAHVGDSRIYLIRNREARLLTLDHSRIFRMIEEGMISPDQAEDHPMGHILERCIGNADAIDVEVRPEPIPLRQGDVLVLCSDGLWSLVNDEELARLFSEDDLKAAVEQAIGMALQRGADDNTTVGALRMEEGPKGGAEVSDVREAMKAQDAVRRIPGSGPTPAIDSRAVQEAPRPWLKIAVVLGLLLFAAAAVMLFTGEDEKSRDDDDGREERESADESKEDESEEGESEEGESEDVEFDEGESDEDESADVEFDEDESEEDETTHDESSQKTDELKTTTEEGK